jgi:release factor glutamine methyltransferase
VGATTWTIRDVLDWATKDFKGRGIDTARLDAELLVAEALGIERIGLYLDLNRPLLEAERSAIRPLIARRREREPVAYILGRRAFYGRCFEVTPDVLIPRPDTEALVERALERIPKDGTVRVLDVGTGSGVVAITLAAERPNAEVTATDISEGALRVASRNAERLGVAERIRFERANLLSDDGPYDLVVSNPPYIRSDDLELLEPEVRTHEPSAALAGGEDGLDVIRALLDRVASATVAGADLLVEVGLGQADDVAALALASPDWIHEATYLDLNRVERVVHLRRT